MTRTIDSARRAFFRQGGALAGGLLVPASALAAGGETIFDFRGGIPPGMRFHRAGSATMTDPDGQVRDVAADVPRILAEGPNKLGLLIEGDATNYLLNASHPGARGWHAGGSVSAAAAPEATTPDGRQGAFRLQRGQQSPDSAYDAVMDGTRAEYGTASVWLRSTGGPGTWRLRLFDFATYNGTATVVEVGPEWKRYALSFAWQGRDTGAKRFSVLFDAPVKPAPQAPMQLNRVNPYKPVSTPLSLESVLMWGAQYEAGNDASSFIPTGDAPATRKADELSFPATLIDRERGSLSFVLPRGGRRGAMLLDAGGIQLGYSNSGWLTARVGAVELAGFGDASADQAVRLEWSRDGVQLLSGTQPMALAVRASSKRDPGPLQLAAQARVGMTQQGERPLNRVLQSLRIDRVAGALHKPVLPSVIPLSYVESFRDDFDDADLSRINENATGGSKEAPAWRSRYRQSRQEVINQEKQIYMDPAFAGSGDKPLGVQPFSIENGILRIRADRADPQNVAPYIWNHRYTSGCISSELTHWQTYGYFEMRARLPRGKGFWPAFWLLPKRNAWPPEIDVLEGSGARPWGVHCGVIERPRAAKTPPGAWIDQFIDTSDGFHTYAVDWTEKNIVFYVDAVKTFEYGPHDIHEDMYMLINLAIGSRDPNWIPDPDDSTPFPAFLEIDYVHAFKPAGAA